MSVHCFWLLLCSRTILYCVPILCNRLSSSDLYFFMVMDTFVAYLTCFMILRVRGFLDTELQASELKVVDGMLTGSDNDIYFAWYTVKIMLEIIWVSPVLLWTCVRRYCICCLVPIALLCQTVRQYLRIGVRQCCSVFASAVHPLTIIYLHTLCQRYWLLNNCKILWKAPWLGPHRWTNNHHHHFRLIIMVDKCSHTIHNKNRRKMVRRPTRYKIINVKKTQWYTNIKLSRMRLTTVSTD